MKSEWKMITLGEACNMIPGFAFKSEDFGNYDNKVVKIGDITPPQVDMKTVTGINIEKYSREKLEKFLANEGDFVFAMTGATIGKVGRIVNGNGYINQRVLKFVANEKIIDKDYLYYSILKNDFLPFVNSHIDSQTAQPNISNTTLAKYTFLLPPLPEQRVIAATLSCLDKKIANNVKLNHHLEQMAQAIFKSWFVDFKPWGDGEFVESEMGLIPKGWRIASLDECTDFSNGYAFSSNELLDGEENDCYHVFKMGHIRKGGGFNSEGTKSWVKRDNCKNILKYVLQKGDLLMCMTDMKGNVALLGHTALMGENDKYIVNQRVGLIRANGIFGIDYPFLYILTNYKAFLDNLRGRANSGVQVNLSTAEIKKSQFVLAPTEVNQQFNEIVMPLFVAIFDNQKENRQLASLRDTLLPRLMSGELSVTDLGEAK